MIGYNFSARTFKNPREQSLKIRIFMIYNNLNEIYMSQLYVPRNHYIYIRAVIEPPPPWKGGGGSAMIDPPYNLNRPPFCVILSPSKNLLGIPIFGLIIRNTGNLTKQNGEIIDYIS